MVSAFFCSLVLLAADPAARPAQDSVPVALETGQLALSLDAKTGAVRELRYQGKGLSSPSESSQQFDLSEDGKWVVGGKRVEPRLVGISKPDARTAVVSMAVGSWQVDLRYQLDAQWPLLTRSARVTWQGKEPTKLKGFWMGLPPMAAGPDTLYFSPGVYPRGNSRPTSSSRGSSEVFTAAWRAGHAAHASVRRSVFPTNSARWPTGRRSPCASWTKPFASSRVSTSKPG